MIGTLVYESESDTVDQLTCTWQHDVKQRYYQFNSVQIKKLAAQYNPFIDRTSICCD